MYGPHFETRTSLLLLAKVGSEVLYGRDGGIEVGRKKVLVYMKGM